MSSNSKLCPECQQRNAAMNLACMKCETSLLQVPFEANYTEKYAAEPSERHYFLEELFNPTLFVCLPLGLFFAMLGVFGAGSGLMPLFLMLSVTLTALPFFPGDPVGDYLRKRINDHAKKQA